SDSVLMNAARPATSSSLPVTWIERYFACTSGDASISTKALFSLATTAAGVFGGAASAYHVVETKFGTVSDIGGASGTAARRSLVPAAMILILPDKCRGSTEPRSAKIISTCPP